MADVIAQFRPSAIFCCGGRSAQMQLLIRVSKLRSAPERILYTPGRTDMISFVELYYICAHFFNSSDQEPGTAGP